MYVTMIPLLAESYRVIAIDMLGYGNSDPPPPDGGAYPVSPDIGIKYVARSVVHTLDALGIERCHLFGVHTGSAIAVEAAAEWPERIGTLSLLGFPVVESEEERTAYFAQMTPRRGLPVMNADGSHLTRLWMQAYSEVLRLWLHTAHPPSEELNPTPVTGFVHEFMTEEHLEYMDRFVLDSHQAKRHVWQITGSLFSYDFNPRLPLIQAPTLHIEPDSPYENAVCRRGAALATMIPNCQAVVLPDSDDNAAEFKAPELAEMMMDFYRKHPL